MEEKISIVIYGISFVIYIAVLLWGLSIVGERDAFAYPFIAWYVVLPLTSLTGSFLLQFNNASLKWIYPAFFGIFGFASTIIILRTVTMFLNQMLIVSFVPALIGTGIGFIMRKWN